MSTTCSHYSLLGRGKTPFLDSFNYRHILYPRKPTNTSKNDKTLKLVKPTQHSPKPTGNTPSTQRPPHKPRIQRDFPAAGLNRLCDLVLRIVRHEAIGNNVWLYLPGSLSILKLPNNAILFVLTLLGISQQFKHICTSRTINRCASAAPIFMIHALMSRVCNWRWGRVRPPKRSSRASGSPGG